MVHGGLRYLQNLDLGLVREALLERQLMVQLAPHLVYPTPFLVPDFADRRRDRRIGVALNMYDVMATTRVGRGRREMRSAREDDEDYYWSPDRHRTIGAEEVLELVPSLAPRGPKSAYLFYDCQTDDVRLTLTVLGEAERFGAVMLNGAEVTEVLLRDGRADGVAFVEADSGERLEVAADNVVNATGVFADRIRPEEVVEEEDVPRISPSRGTHLLVDRERLSTGSAACIVPAGEGRAIFALPWYGRTLIGTTDRDFDGDVDHPRPGADDVAYLLDAVNEFFGTSLGAADLVGAYAGVRPLIATGDPRKSVDISRKAELYETSSAMLTITGGKLTTWRRMARQTVDRMVARRPAARPRFRLAGRRGPTSSMRPPAFRRRPSRSSPSATATPPATCSPSRARTRRWPSRSSPAVPTCSPRPSSPPATSRRVASPMCCCGAPASACWRRRSCAAPRWPAASRRRWARSLAGRGAGSSARRRRGPPRRPRPASTPPARPSTRCNNLPRRQRMEVR
jgi:glycerol-3-phosphate dehydrogenase